MPTLKEILEKGIWSASGQVAKQFIIQRSTGGRQIRSYFIPTNPRTNKQQAWRVLFKSVCDHWNKLDPIDKQIYEEYAKRNYPKKYGFNIYAKSILKEWFKMIIKSVQRGVLDAVNGNNVVGISAVDLEKSIIICEPFSFRIADGGANTAVLNGATFQDSTNIVIRATRGANILNLYCSWQVIEYY